MKIHFYYLGINNKIHFPNGLGILMSVLEQNAYHGSCTYLVQEKDIQTIVPTDLSHFKPDIVGISVVTNQAKYVASLVETIRHYSKAIIIAGGIHATVAPKDLTNKGVDFVFQSEAEISLIEFLKRLAKREEISKIKGIWPNPFARLTDLTQLPIEKKELFHNVSFGEITEKNKGYAGEILTTRGCTYSCNYCCNSTLNKLYEKNLNVKLSEFMRYRPIKQVIDELQAIKKKYVRIRGFIFGDDTFTLNKNYILKFLHEYKNNIAIPFSCNINLLSFDVELAWNLKEAGCFEIKVGIESGSEHLRKKLLGRRISNVEILRKTKVAHKMGLKISTFNMLGLPMETILDLKATLELNSHIRPHRLKFSIFYPYPLTPLRDFCEKKNLLDWNKMATLDNYHTDTPLKFNLKYLQTIQHVWQNLDKAMNKLCGENYYTNIPNLPGMIIKKDDLLK
jgi:anaerobic magnesium-protoporphyrin IX monomethyl ester cyclase